MKKNQKDTDFHNTLGIKYWNKGKIKEATKEFEEAVRINPNHAKAHFNLGMTYRRQGLAEKAIAEFKEAIRINPQFEQAHYLLALTYKEQAQMEKAKHQSDMERLASLHHYSVLLGDLAMKSRKPWWKFWKK